MSARPTETTSRYVWNWFGCRIWIVFYGGSLRVPQSPFTTSGTWGGNILFCRCPTAQHIQNKREKEHTITSIQSFKTIYFYCLSIRQQTDHLTDSIHAHVEGLVVTARAVRHFQLLAVVEALPARHAVQLARVRPLCVRHPTTHKCSLLRNTKEICNAALKEDLKKVVP